MKISIDVSFKNKILDPEAQVIFNTLHSLNFKNAKKVSIHKNFIIDLDIDNRELALKTADEMAKSFLVNLVIEDYIIKIIE